ncbi:MAG: adenylate/guanylate cyclase domain-containing protein [Cyclobacteriaceae bacterium]|nr:adenylate/guanylate cyclase domain-containing protein [Cyclobacteriaceae bacterium]
MRSYNKKDIKWISVNAITWSLSKQLFLAIQLWGVGRANTAQLPASLLFTVIALTGLLEGTVFGCLDVILDRVFKKIRFTGRVIINVCINLGVGLLLTTLLLPPMVGSVVINEVAALSTLLVTSNVLIIAIYMLLVTFLLQFSKVAAMWIQTHDIRQLFSSDEQVEEDRIFMFLDMKSSTSHAESLGPARYSMLIRDCFSDMSEAAGRNKAELYQYVGDEVVFTWKTSDENIERSIQLYFEFKEALNNRSMYYMKHYGIIPEFKAGIHQGKVIRACVSSIRKATAYHGDAINTASRIQDKCNALSCGLLISSGLRKALPEYYKTFRKGHFQLRGKHEVIELFTVKRTEPESIIPLQSIMAGNRTFRVWLNMF